MVTDGVLISYPRARTHNALMQLGKVDLGTSLLTLSRQLQVTAVQNFGDDTQQSGDVSTKKHTLPGSKFRTNARVSLSRAFLDISVTYVKIVREHATPRQNG